MLRKNLFTLSLAVLILAVLSAVFSYELSATHDPNPSFGTATVDGNSGEWNLVNDLFANMYQAGRNSKANLTDVYLRYDCSTNTMYVLVLATAGNTIDQNSALDNQFVKIDSSKAVDGALGGGASFQPNGFSFINPTGTDADGWEASFILAEGTYLVEVHAQANDSGGDSQTSATTEDDSASNREIDLTVTCPAAATGSIKITENTVPDDAQDFDYTATNLTPNSFMLDDDSDVTLSSMRTYSSLADGTYSVTQSVATGYDLTDINCTGSTNSTITYNPSGGNSFIAGDTSVSINLSSAEDIECTFQNEPSAPAVLGSIKITENTIPDDAQNFLYSATNLSPLAFNLDDDSDPTLSNMRTYSSLADGTYSVTQSVAAGYDLTDITCTGGTNSTITYNPSGGNSFTAGDTSVSINLSSAEDIECTFQNEPTAPVLGSITIIEDTVPNAPQNFDFNATGGLTPNSFELDDDSNPALSNTRVFSNLPVGNYTVTQDIRAGFDLIGISCTGAGGSTILIGTNAVFNTGDQTTDITLAAGEDIICTFSNSKPNAAQFDFGDAPDGVGGFNYPTLKSNNGAKHKLGSGLRFGDEIDSEADGQPDTDARNDEASNNDEDGATLPALLLEGEEPRFSIDVVNPTGSTATVTCWLDMDGDGDFETSERVTDTVAAGTNQSLTIGFGSNVPAGAAALTGGSTYARCRLSTAGVLNPDGEASDGEVEDFHVFIGTVDKDTDSDGVPDSEETTLDSDDDGIPDFQDFDPQGYFYCRDSGQILPGGSISVAGPAPIILLNGSSGEYSFNVGATGVYTVTVTPPPGTTLDLTLLNPATFDPSGLANPVTLGPGQIGATGFLAPGFPTAYFLSFQLGDIGDPLVFNNNFAFTGGPCVATAAVGGDPPIWENIMVFPTPEKFEGRDLNNDGDLNDTILRYEDLNTNRVYNTGINVSQNHRDIDIYGDNIVFVARDDSLLNSIRRWFNPSGEIGVYNIKTKLTSMLGVWGDRPSIYKNLVSISGSQVRFYNLSTQSLTETGIAGHNQAIWGDWIAYQSTERGELVSNINLYNIRNGSIIETGAAGEYPTIHENYVAFEHREHLYYYDIENRNVVDTGYAGTDAVIYGDKIVYSDGKRIYYFDISTGIAFHTGKSGLEPDIYEDTITYYVWEDWKGTDINADGDRSDPIVGTHLISESDVALKSRAELAVAAAAIHGIQGSRTPGGLRLKVHGAGIDSAQLEVLALDGRVMFESGFVSGQQLHWNMRRQDGAVLANGVYLYRVLVKSASGDVVHSEVRKLLVLR